MGMIVEEEATGTPAPLIPNDTRRSNVNQTSSRGENCVFPPSRTFVIPCPSEILLTRLFPSLPSLSISFGRWRNDPKSRSSPTTVCVIRGYIRRIKVDETWFRARNRSIFESISLLHISSNLHTRVIVIHWVEKRWSSRRKPDGGSFL